VGADRRQLRESRRAQIRSFVLEEDHAPRRARFASDPAVLAVALAFATREPTSEVRPGVGTPRSLMVRFGQRFGRDVEAIAMVSALSRAVGLWDASACSTASPPGAYSIHELTQVLFTTWRSGGAWDEARQEREVLRVAEGSRDHSPIGALREMVIDAMQDLGEGRWVPWQAVYGYLAADEQIAGVERVLRRWAERASVEPPEVLEVARRIALESLPSLGIIDLGSGPDDPSGVAIRLTPRGRALLAGTAPPMDSAVSKFIDTQALRIGSATLVGSVLGLASFAELGKVGEQLDLIVTPPSLARALSAGVESDAVRARIEAVAPLPESISRVLAQASVVIGRASLVRSSAFLWIEDSEIRELLRTRRPAAELFVDPSPPGGLLVQSDVDVERLVRRCRALGVEVEVDGAQLRSRSTTPIPSEAAVRSSTTRVKVRSKTPYPRTK